MVQANHVQHASLTSTRERQFCSPGGSRPRFVRYPVLAFLCALCLGVAAGTGCASSGKGAPAEVAAVNIQDHTPKEIGQAAAEVFREHGYTVAHQDKTHLTFEKQGSKMNNLVYGDWMPGSSVWLRVQASISPVNETTFHLQCDAHLISGKGETTEETVKFAHVSTAPIQALLDEVARRLREQPHEAEPSADTAPR
jgi:arylsulfatase A-like enzyme